MPRAHLKIRARLAASGALILALALAGPAGAGVVYSWTTDQGTRAFTDDAEKIPARYAEQVKEQSLQSLRSYPRLTIEAVTEKPQDRPSSEPVPRATERVQAAPAGLSVLVGGTRFGANATVVPIGREADESAPTLIETYRVQPRDSMATTHETVISQGGRVISVRRDELSQADYTGMVPPVR